MFSRKLWIASGCTALVFFGGLGYYVYQSEMSPARTQSSKKDSNRLFENSFITSQTDKVEDEPSALFNDPAISQAWGLKKSDAARAWSITKGSKEILVAIIDTGIDVNHEDLADNLWKNPGETGKDAQGRDKASNGVDDDNNGFIDDVHGWNFVSNNPKLDDNHGHGTHIAGIVGAEAGNGKGIIGISPQVSLMILKYYDPKVPSADNLKNTVASIKYAVKMGANIINYSGGGTEFSQEEHDAVAEAEKKGILFVAAAGNERSNSDQHHYYPADYKLRNIISVTAIDPATQVLSSSNYGVDTVDIAAPGQNILSCLPNNSYGYMTGTSQATAFVTGAAALVMAHKQNFQAEEVKRYILSTGDAQTQLASKTKSSRQLNLFKALAILDQGVSATGVVAVNTQNIKRFTADPNDKNSKLTAEDGVDQTASDMSHFGRSLIDAMGSKIKPSKVGTKQDGEGF
ncbi:S8 family peptidase [Bdellovibrio svalbardensis]|uniref:S8 family serine peptidase n=1 Tax=Bdellovibrio svalbardensis TaxID=2972972 RepID=A0ABT6DMA0_9BACT|nr:S8 family peptidase [Bdellovibrio svalbardensis]MDG0817776.1 S8 family serine peptidase [Bdellovibrio svalbardensis]